MAIDSLMKYVKMNFFIILGALAFILVPSFALIAFSQSNDTSSDNKLSDGDASSNQSSFSILSRELANQSESVGKSSEGDK